MSKNLIDLSGKIFGRLTVIKLYGKNNSGRYKWACRCECGKIVTIIACHLISGHTKSCGCLAIELNLITNLKHGHSRSKSKGTSKIYKAWQHMIQRCNNHNDKGYKNYGGRGIKVCYKWF